jgi:voltage-gated potassium channel
MRAMQLAMRRRGLAYVLALTVVVVFAGAAGVYQFENPRALAAAGLRSEGAAGIGSYGEAVWWTAMMLTTMGSDYFPRSSEGRIIAWLLAVYAFAIFGYITATVASLIILVEQPQAAEEAKALRRELAELRALVEPLARQSLSRGRPASSASG